MYSYAVPAFITISNLQTHIDSKLHTGYMWLHPSIVHPQTRSKRKKGNAQPACDGCT